MKAIKLARLCIIPFAAILAAVLILNAFCPSIWLSAYAHIAFPKGKYPALYQSAVEKVIDPAAVEKPKETTMISCYGFSFQVPWKAAQVPSLSETSTRYDTSDGEVVLVMDQRGYSIVSMLKKGLSTEKIHKFIDYYGVKLLSSDFEFLKTEYSSSFTKVHFYTPINDSKLIYGMTILRSEEFNRDYYFSTGFINGFQSNSNHSLEIYDKYNNRIVIMAVSKNSAQADMDYIISTIRSTADKQYTPKAD